MSHGPRTTTAGADHGVGANHDADVALRRRDLHEGWTLTVTDGPAPLEITDVPATVPGTFVTDLLQADLLPDPYLDRHEHEVSWTGECDVAYRTRFTWEPDAHRPADRVDLVAASLDTSASIVLNGQEIARVCNQHRSWRFDVTAALRPGENELEIRFDAPLRIARDNEEIFGVMPQAGNELPFNAIRKMACNFGWDWGPVIVTSGIAGPIGLEEWSAARLDEVRPRVEMDRETGRVRVQTRIEQVTEGPLQVRARILDPEGTEVASEVRDVESSGSTGAGSPEAGSPWTTLELEVPGARRWWPRGYGEQPLYTVHIELLGPDGGADADGGAADNGPDDSGTGVGLPLDARTHRIGFRTAGIREEPDEIGTSFTVVVNDRPILAQGANWIPEDCFPTRLGPEDYRARLQDAVDAGMNMLRIWGGGLYESELLYDLADELGLMVWQDFTLACAAYSELDQLRTEIEAEARESIVRLAWHPSLVHWNGSNENVEGYWTWGWHETLPEGTGWGDLYYSEIFPQLLEELDGTRSYTPSSPYSRPLPQDPKNPAHGTVHDWRVWNQLDYTHYRDLVPRFSAEFGFQGPANRATVERAITERPLDPDSPAMLSHQKAGDGQAKLRRGYAPHLPEPRDWPDFHATTQLNQARALICGISHYRSWWPVCGGTIVWQLNDCWPVTSWAAVDGDGRRKLLWYALRDVYAPVLVTVQPREEGLAVSISNDTDEELCARVVLSRRTLDGQVLAEGTPAAGWTTTADGATTGVDCSLEENDTVTVPARGTATLGIPEHLARAGDPARELLLVGLEGRAERALHWFAEDRDSALAPDAARVHADRDGEDVLVTVQARSTIKDLCLFADAVTPSAVVDRQLVTLVPGEEAVFRVSGAAGAEPREFLRPDVLISANDLVARGDAAANQDLADAHRPGGTTAATHATATGGYAGPAGYTGPRTLG